jgi:predicted nucleotidyltransferase
VGERMKKIYPKNKELFKELIPFTKKIISLCEKNKITPVIYGSFAHFYFTRDENMKVNDIDIMIDKKFLPKMSEILKKEKIRHNYYPKWETLIIKKGKLKVELDEVGAGYKTLNAKNFIRVSKKIDFYGKKVRMITLKNLLDIYPVAYKRSKDDKARILKKIKHIEKFLGKEILKK